MKAPFIGINMDYSSYPDYPATDPQFRDCYDIYAPYVDVVADAGGVPLLVPCLNNESLLGKYVELIDGFVFTGGEDYPSEFYGELSEPETTVCHKRRSQIDIKLVHLVLATGMPVLGICGGLQLINIAAGGKLIQHLKNADTHRATSHTHDAEHSVTIIKGTILASMFGVERLVVNSAHHQGVHPEHIGNGLRITAQADDGTIEALEPVEERFLLAIQWHPERIQDSEHCWRIFSAFIKASNEWRI
jgi:putative glutamine amidotransferase